MHFLVDDEIKQYQLIDEHMHEADRNGESLSFKQAKTSILKLH